jgi:hypothetical protein
MIRVVLDTNVLVSAVISPAGPNAQVFDLIVADRISPMSPKLFARNMIWSLNTNGSIISTGDMFLRFGACSIAQRHSLNPEDGSRFPNTRKTIAFMNALWPPRLTTSSRKTPGISHILTKAPGSLPLGNFFGFCQIRPDL